MGQCAPGPYWCVIRREGRAARAGEPEMLEEADGSTLLNRVLDMRSEWILHIFAYEERGTQGLALRCWTRGSSPAGTWCYLLPLTEEEWQGWREAS